MSLYGPKGVRLHEEVIPITGRIGADGQLRLLRQGLDAEVLTLASLDDALRDGKAASEAISTEALNRFQRVIQNFQVASQDQKDSVRRDSPLTYTEAHVAYGSSPGLLANSRANRERPALVRFTLTRGWSST